MSKCWGERESLLRGSGCYSGKLGKAAGVMSWRVSFDVRVEDIPYEYGARPEIGPVAGSSIRLAHVMTRWRQVCALSRIQLSQIAETLEFASGAAGQLEEHVETIMPGYTHLQHAQPISFAHHLLALLSDVQP